MKKLYFRYGAMCSGKSLHLMSVAKNYGIQGKDALIYTSIPSNDDGEKRGHKISSRILGEMPCKPLYHNTRWDMEFEELHMISCVLVDECQFLLPEGVDALREVTVRWNVPVICYGLRTDWRSHLFPGSRRLLEIADSIEEIKTTCFVCEKKATMNKKLSPNQCTIELEKTLYLPACFQCYQGEDTWKV